MSAASVATANDDAASVASTAKSFKTDLNTAASASGIEGKSPPRDVHKHHITFNPQAIFFFLLDCIVALVLLLIVLVECLVEIAILIYQHAAKVFRVIGRICRFIYEKPDVAKDLFWTSWHLASVSYHNGLWSFRECFQMFVGNSFGKMNEQQEKAQKAKAQKRTYISSRSYFSGSQAGAKSPGGKPATSPGGKPAMSPGGKNVAAASKPATSPGGKPATSPVVKKTK